MRLNEISQHVRFWHKADVRTRSTNVRFWGGVKGHRDGELSSRTPGGLFGGGWPLWNPSRSLVLSFRHPCMGTTVMDRNNRIGRRERREILKSTQGLGKGVVDADKGELEPLRPNTIPDIARLPGASYWPLSGAPGPLEPFISVMGQLDFRGGSDSNLAL